MADAGDEIEFRSAGPCGGERLRRLAGLAADLRGGGRRAPAAAIWFNFQAGNDDSRSPSFED